jgi:hypothetical protein
MNIENIIETSAISFGAGIITGYVKERNYGLRLDIKEEIEKIRREKYEEKKPLDKRHKTRLYLSIISGGIISSIYQKDEFIGGLAINTLSFYTGQLIGEATHKILNTKPITKEDEQKIKEFTQSVKGVDDRNIFHKHQHRNEGAKILNYLREKNNPKLTKHFVEQYAETIEYNEIYEILEKEIEKPDYTSRMIRSPPLKKDRLTIIVKHENGVIQKSKLNIIQEDNKEGFVKYLSMYDFETECYENKTTQELTNIILEAKKETPIVITKAKNESIEKTLNKEYLKYLKYIKTNSKKLF